MTRPRVSLGTERTRAHRVGGTACRPSAPDLTGSADSADFAEPAESVGHTGPDAGHPDDGTDGMVDSGRGPGLPSGSGRKTRRVRT